MATFTVGSRVWYKRAGSTPFIAGDSTSVSGVYDAEQGGRNPAAISIVESTFKIGTSQGVPRILDADLAKSILTDTFVAISGVYDTSNTTQGVVEQQVANPLSPKVVTIPSGAFAPPTGKALYNTGSVGGQIVDEGATNRPSASNANTILSQDPAVRRAETAEGIAVTYGGTHEFASETVDIATASKRLGLRLPSAIIQPGVVVAVKTDARTTGVSPDGSGTKTAAGVIYTVLWGASGSSNPHKVKRLNRQLSLEHAQEDLVAA